jgi:hypothetical protein
MRQPNYQDALFTLMCIAANQVLECSTSSADFVKLVHPSYEGSDSTSPVYKATADAIANAKQWADSQEKSTEKKKKKSQVIAATELHVFHWFCDRCELKNVKYNESPTAQAVWDNFNEWCEANNIQCNKYYFQKTKFEEVLEKLGFEIKVGSSRIRRVHYLQWKTPQLSSSPSK